MVASCCEKNYGHYIIEEGDLSREALDKIFGEDNYELTIEKKFQNYKETVDKWFGEGFEYLRKTPNGILVRQVIMQQGEVLMVDIKHFQREIFERKYIYTYKVKTQDKEITLCDCDCHVIGCNMDH